MNIVVCLKQVPSTTDVKIDPQTNTLVRQGIKSIVNPLDTYALEEGVRIKERYGGRVTAISMGPAQAEEMLREAIATGADDAILLSDAAFAGADTLATSYVLSEAVKKVGSFDIIFAGRQAIDGDTAQVGPQTAEKLGLPQVTYTEKIIDIKKNIVTIRRKIDGGHEVLESPLPLLITVIKDAAIPRPFKATRVMAYKNARSLVELEKMVEGNSLLYLEDLKEEYNSKSLFIDTLTMDELSVEAERCGLHGSPTKVFKIDSVVLGGGEHIKIEPTKEGLGQLVDKLMDDHIFG